MIKKLQLREKMVDNLTDENLILKENYQKLAG